MAFPLIISGYDKDRCSTCPFLKYKDDYSECRCMLFGDLHTHDYSKHGQYVRHDDCIEMEQQSAAKNQSRDINPYDLNTVATTVAKIKKMRKK